MFCSEGVDAGTLNSLWEQEAMRLAQYIEKKSSNTGLFACICLQMFSMTSISYHSTLLVMLQLEYYL